MAIETSPAHDPFKSRAAPSRLGMLGLGLLVVTWTMLTVLHAGRVLPTSAVAASPERIGEGRVWLLFTSGLLVQRPLVLSLMSAVALACVVLVVCGTRVFWVSALLGHVLSTVVTYALLAAARSVDPDAYRGLLRMSDYGVSAIAAAWLGAIAYSAWRRRGSSLRGKAAIVLSCIAVAVFALMVQRHAQRHLTFLDSEHGFAFLFGILAAQIQWHAGLHPLRFLRRAVVS